MLSDFDDVLDPTPRSNRLIRAVGKKMAETEEKQENGSKQLVSTGADARYGTQTRVSARRAESCM